MRSVRRQHIRLLIGISIGALCLIAAVDGVLYRQNFAATREQLLLAVRSQVRLIEAVARFDAAHAEGDERNAFRATLEQVRDAYQSYPGIGATGEFVFGYMQDEQIRFVPRPGATPIMPVPFWSRAALPMRLALAGQTGTVIGRDYRDLLVLAAYAPVAPLKLGVVAKINLAELRAPFILWGLFAGALAVLFVLLGALPMLRSMAPLVRRLAESEDLNSRSRTQLLQAQQMAQLGYWEWDLATGTLEFSDELLHMAGLERGQVRIDDRVVRRVVHPDDLPAYLDALRRTRDEGTPLRMDHRVLRPDGSVAHASHQAEAVRDEHGRPTRVLGVVQDITERKRAEDELHANERLLATLLDALPAPIVLKDRAGRYRLVNRAMAAQHGLDPDTLRELTIRDMAHRTEEERRLAEETDRRVLEHGETLDLPEVVVHLADGREVWRRVVKAPVHDETGAVVGLVALGEDITERKRAEDEVRRSMRHMALLQRVAVASNEAPTPEEALRVALAAVCETVGCPLGHVYLCSATDPERLEPSGIWHVEGGTRFAEFRAVTERTTFRIGEGLPGRVLQARAPAWIEDLRADRNFPRAQMQHSLELHSGFAFPMRVGSEVVGALEFFCERPMPEQPGLLDVLGQVGMQLGRVVERHRAAMELQASEERFRNLVEGSVQGVLIIRDFKPVFANQAFADILGYANPDTVLAEWSFEASFSEHERERMMRYHRARMAGAPAPTSYEVQARRTDGTLVWCETTASQVLWDGTNATQIATQDITERKLAEEALRASEERFRNLIEGSLQGVVILVGDRPLFANQAYADLLGYADPEEVLRDWTFEKAFPAEELPFVLRNYESRLRGEPALAYYELQYRRVDGTLVWAEVNARVITWEGQRATQVTTHAITERKRAESALRASEERFRNLIEGSHQGIAIFRGSETLFVNQAFARIHGYDTPDQIMALAGLSELIDPDDLPRAREREAQAGNGGAGADTQIQLTGVCRDGRRVQLEAMFQAIEWQGQGAIQITVVDVSDRTRLEEQLRQAQKMEAVGQLAGGVAHDFNNILQVIRGYAELAHGAITDKRAAGYLDRVLKAAEGASHVIRQLLALSRREILRPRNLDANRLIADLMEMVRRVIGEDIELMVQTDPQPAVVRGDPTMLEQVLLNLCVNARDAMPGGGRLTIRTLAAPMDARPASPGPGRHGPFVAIEVQDTGVGIPAEDREHIFEPFFTTKEAGKGTGLGLSMAYGIVQQHEGLMEVASTQGMGTTFRIYLPATEADAELAAAPEIEDAPGGHETVLVAEDEAAVLRLVVQLLESRGYRVLMARDGEEALQVFEAHSDEIDLAVLDVVMPRKSGRTVYHALQARRPDLPILFSTGYTADALDPDFVRSHGFYIIRKPYRPGSLFAAVREALEQPWPPPLTGDLTVEGRALPKPTA